MLETENRISCEKFQDFLVKEARLEDVSVGEDTLKITYILDGDPLEFALRYDTISFTAPQLAARVQEFAVTLGVIAFLRFGAVLPGRLDLKKYSKYIDWQLLEFLELVIRGHWSEHRYQVGKLGYMGPEFLVEDSEIGKEVNYPIWRMAEVKDAVEVILASGSGKDSVLCSLLLETAGINYEILTYIYDLYGDKEKQSELFEKVTSNLKHRRQHHLYLEDRYHPWLSERMGKTNLQARLKECFPAKPFRTDAGEVVLAALIIAPIQIIYGIPIVAFGNEKSADAPNFVEPHTGESIAHQWAKSFTCEQAVGKLMARLFQGINRVSLTKPIHDVKIFDTLFRLGDELPYATNSCNIEKPWCCRCEKCCYVFAGFCAYGDYEKVVEAFGKDLLNMEENLRIWSELLGLEGYIPWECVGQPEEAQFDFYKLYQRGVKNQAMDLFERSILVPLQSKGEEQVKEYFQRIEQQFSRVYENHRTMPDWLWEKIKPVLN